MASRGQMGLDLVIALILVLIVFLGFAQLVSQFEKSQLEMSLRQQLQQNADVVGELTIHAFQYYRLNLDYPVGYKTFTPIFNQYTHMTGRIHTSPVRGIHFANGYNCKFNIAYTFVPTGVSSGIISISLPASQTGLSRDVNGIKNVVATPGVNTKYNLLLPNCGYDFVIG